MAGRAGRRGGSRFLYRVQKNFFNERLLARPSPRKKHQLSLVNFRQLFCQYEIEICTTCTYQVEMFIFVSRFHEKYNLMTQFEQILRSFFGVVVIMLVVGT